MQDFLTKNTADMEKFYLHDRAMHVYSEAARVYRFKKLCDELSRKNSVNKHEVEETLKQLGQIMKESHKSTRDWYCCSHSALDKLVELSEDLTYGARLTGAG